MDDKLFDQLKGALKDAKKYEEGNKLDLRVTELPPPTLHAFSKADYSDQGENVCLSGCFRSPVECQPCNDPGMGTGPT
ncbi:hypothetical protein ACFL6R_02535 [Gemmatimonadota bacterium]